MKIFFRIALTVTLACAWVTFGFAQRDTLTILHVNDTHSNLAPTGPRSSDLQGTRGGIARAASLIGSLRMSNPKTLLLHAGDAFVGDLFFNRYFGVAELQLMQQLGFDAMAVGNHEFDLTPQVLNSALDNAFANGSFPLLSANLSLDAPDVQGLKQYISPFVVKQFGALKVGIFGMTTPETNILSQPSPAWVDTNIVEIAAAMVDSLKARGCSVVICLSHLGVALDQLVASYVPGIHVIVGGHDHYLFEKPLAITNPVGATTWIVQANAFYQNLGKLMLTVEHGTVNLLSYEMLSIDNTIPEEPTVKAVVSTLIEGIEQQYGKVYTEQIGTVQSHCEEVAADLLSTGDKDTPIGNLVTDAFRAATGTDIAIEVGGSTAQPLCQGPIVAADVFRVVGYGFNTDNGLGYRLATFKISGEALLAGLEFGLSSIEQNDEFFVQVSGMRYTYNPKTPAYARLVSAQVGTTVLDPQKVYTVTSNEFVPVFLDYLSIPYSNLHVWSDTTEFQVVTGYIAAQGTIVPTVAGRIRATSPAVTAVEQRGSAPRDFQLFQNYPNPFNPSTTIAYDISSLLHVTLKVFNLLGQEMMTLADAWQTPGRYNLQADFSRLPSGIYIYRLDANNVSKTKKLVLLK
jgi:5'-nucleotidase